MYIHLDTFRKSRHDIRVSFTNLNSKAKVSENLHPERIFRQALVLPAGTEGMGLNVAVFEQRLVTTSTRPLFITGLTNPIHPKGCLIHCYITDECYFKDWTDWSFNGYEVSLGFRSVCKWSTLTQRLKRMQSYDLLSTASVKKNPSPVWLHCRIKIWTGEASRH